MVKTILLIIVLTLFGLANAQINFGGPCPNRPVQRDFNLTKYSGPWQEYAKYPASFEGNSKCVADVFLFSPNAPHEAYIVKRMVNPSTGEKKTIIGHAKQISDGKFTVTYNDPKIPTNYWVLSTDHDTYSIVYSCQPARGNSHNTYVWILTAAPRPSAATIAKAKNVLRSKGISLAHLTVTDQTNC